jgi:vitamin B12 transporter
VILDPSGSPVHGARLECGGRTAESGPDGRFVIPNISRCQASIRAQGFATKKLEIAAGSPTRVELDIESLSQRIVVSATRREANIDEAGVAATVLTGTDLAIREFPAVGDVLRDIPGIQIAQYGTPGSLTQVFTRGAQRTGTLVLLDGVPLNDPGGELNLAGLTTAPLDRIEVVRGPESALFGAEASAGVIQLFTRRGDPEQTVPRGSVSYERGSFQTDRWIANLAGGSGGRLDYALTGEQFHTAGEYANSFFRNTAGTANLGYRISENTQFRGFYREFDATVGTPNQIRYGIVDNNASELSRDSALGLRIDDARGSHYTQRFSFGYHRLRDTFLNPAPDGPYSIAALMRDTTSPVPRVYLEQLVDPNFPASQIPAGMRLVKPDVSYLLFTSDPYINLTSRREFGYQGTLAHAGGDAIWGYEYEREGGSISGRDADRENHGFFVHKQQAIAGRIFLSGGIRLEQNSVFHTKLTPRGAASFQVTGQHGALSSTFFRLSAARGITEPTLVQNFSKEFYAVGNPALRPEKTSSYEAGIVQEWFNRRLRTEASAFRNSFRDLIAYAYPTWQNVEASWARGLEFSAQAKVARLVMLSGNYTRLWTRITNSYSPASLFTGIGQELARRPGNSGSVSMSLTPKKFWFQTGAVFVGERQDTDLFGTTRNRGYQSVYAAGSLRLNRHVTPFLRVDNLLNSHFEEILGYANLSRSATGGLRLGW